MSMDISSKRFKVWTDENGGGTFVRDNSAPYHVKSVAMDDLPTVTQMALMSEAAFDRAISALVYNGAG
jgi:hypothetical protein